MNCTRCGRRLKHASASGLGPRCELAVLGPRPKVDRHGRVRVRLFDRIPRDPDPYSLSLFEEQANA